MKQGNEKLMTYLTTQQLMQMAELIIQEPKFSDSPARCFQLPFLACETFTTDVQVISDAVLGEKSSQENKQK